MLDHPGFVRRGLTQRAGRQGDGEMVELKLFIPGEKRFHHHRLLLRIEHRLRFALWSDKRRKRYVQPGGDFPQGRDRRAGLIAFDLPIWSINPAAPNLTAPKASGSGLKVRMIGVNGSPKSIWNISASADVQEF